MPGERVRVVNLSRGTVLAEKAEVADSFLRRGLGLMGRRDWSHGDALIIDPCSSIHCLFMRITIDAVFADAEGVVRRAVPNIRPWSPAVIAWGARYVVELPAGSIALTGTAKGDRISVQSLPQ